MKELDLKQVLSILTKLPRNYRVRTVVNLDTPLGLAGLKGYNKAFDIDDENKVVYLKFKSL